MPNELENAPTPTPERKLAAAPTGWLEGAIAKLRQIGFELGCADSPDEVMRRAVLAGRRTLGFNRMGIWLFEKGHRSLTGTFGVDANGNVVDERHCRVFDHGSIGKQKEGWLRPPYYFVKLDDELRDSEGGVISKGIHFTVPLMRKGEVAGFVAVDDLLESDAVNDRTGALLGLFADAVCAQYFAKIDERRALAAEDNSARADSIKREFLGMLSHEVRTPLNAILGFAQLLCLDSDSPDQKKLAGTIEQSGDHLLNLLNSMMDYADLAAEDLRQRFAPCRPAQIAQETAESFSQIAARKGLAIDFRHEGGFNGKVMADAVGLRQILGNLVQNAIKFTRHGTITVLAQSQAKPQNSVAFFFSVEDTGCGIEAEHLSDIFKPFKQIDSSLTRAHGGIGMGLAIVERLATAMGGEIHCESQPGRGTRFTLDFVFENAGAELVVAKHPIGTRTPANDDPAKMKLLIAEDNEFNRLLLSTLLQRLGYSPPDQAVDGQEAHKLISQRPYDLLLLDLQIPKVDGLTLTRQVREGRCGPINSDVPIIGLTAHNNEYDRDRCMLGGMNDYLAKPFKAEQLQEAIRQLITA